MNCPECGKEMRKGYLFSTKDGALSFANEVPGMLHNAKNEEGFVEVTPRVSGHRASAEAYCCENCRVIQIRY